MFIELKILKDKVKNLKLECDAHQIGLIIKSAQETYTIKSGDSFSRISGGDPVYRSLIEEANPGVNPSRLQIGQEIILPPKPIRPNENMNPSVNAINLIKKYESKPGTMEPFLEPYSDGFGNVTIGWGHNYGQGLVSSYGPISRSRAESLLLDDIEVAASFLRRNVGVSLTQGQFDALTSLVFNAGTGLVFRSRLFKAVDSGNFSEAESIFPNTLIGQNQGGLIQRRQEEAELFRS